MKRLYNTQFCRWSSLKSANTYNKLLFFLLVSLCSPLEISAQGNRSIYGMTSKIDDFYPVSAEAAALFTKVPEEVDYCRGRVTFRIPLYEIKTPSFTLPISLTYTTGGIKVGEQTGAVGLGWHLEAEPMITRDIRGLPDNYSLIRDSSYQKHYNSDFLAHVGRGDRDMLNDLFYYRALQSSGKFCLNSSDDGAFHPRIITTEPVNISVPGGHVSYYFQDPIHLTDANGTLYVFGETPNARETTSIPTNSAENTTWKASRIQSVNGEEMTFSYKENLLPEQHIGQYDYYAVEDNTDSPGATLPDIPVSPGYWKGVSGVERFYIPHNDGTVSIWGQTQYYSTGTIYVNTRRISQINFLNGSIQFNYSSLTNTLESMQVYGPEGLLIKEFVFESTRRSYDRALLDRIIIKGSDRTAYQKYEFKYRLPNTSDYSPYTKGIDWWGYYNGVNNADLVPVQTVPMRDNNGSTVHQVKIGGATNRNPSLGHTLCYALDRITYPTGGYTAIVYEQNVVTAPGTGLYQIPAGGARIRELIESPSVDGQPQVRSFKYRLTPGHTFDSGFMLFPFTQWRYKGAYRKKMKKMYAVEFGSSLGFRTVSKDYTLYLQDNIYTSDNSIYYYVVDETIGNTLIHHLYPRAYSVGLNDSESYIAGYNVPLDEGERINAHNIHQTESGESIRREEKMTASNLNYLTNLERTTLIVDRTTAPNYIQMNEYYERAFRQKNYPIAIHWPYPDKILTTDSLPGKSMKKELKYNYGYHTANGKSYNQLADIEQITPEGDKYKTEYSYAYSKSGAPYNAMVAKNDVATPIEERQYVNDELKKTVRYTYRTDAKVNSGYCLDKIVENTNDANTEFRDVETYDDYLSCGRPLQITRKDGTKVSFLWAYGGVYAIAIAENLTIQEIRLRAGIDPETLAKGNVDMTEVYQKIKLLRETCPQAHITMYDHIPLIGMKERDNPNGTGQHAIYDTFGRLKEERNTDRKIVKSYEYNLINPTSNK